MDQLISKRIANQHFSLILLLSFAGLAILLAAVGLYDVISYSTAQRTSEFGMRLALGARPKDLIRSVLHHVLLQLGQILERVRAAQFAAVNEQIAHTSAVPGLIKQRILSVN